MMRRRRRVDGVGTSSTSSTSSTWSLAIAVLYFFVISLEVHYNRLQQRQQQQQQPKDPRQHLVLPSLAILSSCLAFTPPSTTTTTITTRRQLLQQRVVNMHHYWEPHYFQPNQFIQQRTISSTTSHFPTSTVILLSTADATTYSEEEEDNDQNPSDGGVSSSSSSSLSSSSLSIKKRRLTQEFLRIGGPALIQLAAEPLAGLVDSAYLGRLGPEVLGGAGVAISAQYAVSKLYNDPLLRTSISLVASQDGKQRSSNGNGSSSTTAEIQQQEQQHEQLLQQQQDEQRKKDELSIAISSALLLAGTVGLIQLLVYSVFCRGITQSMGLTPTSPMWHSALSYLQVRALGTPAATLWLVTNGIFRGLGDTTTPLVYSLAFSLLNALLDPIFIFVWNWGASGAAAGTALAQYTALIPLLLALNRRVPIKIWSQLRQLKSSLQQYIRAGGLVLFRTVGKVLAYAICARQAALLGSTASAAYNLTFQLGFATTQICEAVAVAVQTLMARELTTTSSSPTRKARIVQHLIQMALWTGGTVAILLSLLTYARKEAIMAGLTNIPQVQIAALNIFPVVLLTQVFKGLAYPVNGIIMGGLDWFFAMFTMWMANLSCIATLRYFANRTVTSAVTGGVATTGLVSLEQIWWALAAFMGTQVVAGILRFESKTGVWTVLKNKR